MSNRQSRENCILFLITTHVFPNSWYIIQCWFLMLWSKSKAPEVVHGKVIAGIWINHRERSMRFHPELTAEKFDYLLVKIRLEKRILWANNPFFRPQTVNKPESVTAVWVTILIGRTIIRCLRKIELSAKISGFLVQRFFTIKFISSKVFLKPHTVPRKKTKSKNMLLDFGVLGLSKDGITKIFATYIIRKLLEDAKRHYRKYLTIASLKVPWVSRKM